MSSTTIGPGPFATGQGGYGASDAPPKFRMSPVDESLPRYRLVTPWFGPDDVWRPDGTVITYEGHPNENMIPLNDAAEARMGEYLAYLDQCAALKAAMDGRAFVRRAGDMGDFVAAEIAARPKHERSIPRESGPVPVRPDLATPVERRRRAAEKGKQLHSAVEPQPPGREGEPEPVRILGSRYTDDAARMAR